MKNIFIRKLMALTIATSTFLGFGSITAHAEWRQDNNGWWNAEGNSYSTGWKDINSKWYYFNPNGYMKTGWMSDNGKWYYLKDDGSMAVNETVNGQYKVDNNGVWIQNTTVKSNNTSTVNNINSNNTTNTNVINNVNNGIVINGNVNIGNTTNNNTAIQQNNNNNNDSDTKSGQVSNVPNSDVNNTVNSIYPCWTILNGKYYHINKDKEIDYDKTVDGYVIGTDGAWEQKSSITPPKAIELPYGYKLQALQVIQKLQHEAKLDDLRKESKEEKHQYRMDKIKELQDKIDDIKKHNYNNGQEMLQKYENEIKALEIQDENDYK
jgi:hypothetical protein